VKRGAGVICLLISFCLWMAFGCTQSRPRIGDPSPRIELCDLTGNRMAVPDDLRDKIIILRFWGDCCSYDINEMSRVDQICRKYEEKGLRIVTIHTGKPRKVAEDFASMLKIKLPVLVDPDSSIARRYGVSELPSTFIIDRKGVIRARMTGHLEGPIAPVYEKVVTPLLD
jgi:cytochrome c biogenesis protein CcmG, thiol:disulfide interchange protein DsbE